MIIYKTTNIINGKIYIGKDSNDNPSYLGSGLYLKRAIKKYGKENFIKETLEICDLSNINEREIYWIAKLDARNLKIGYNITMGGEGTGSGVDHPKFGKHYIFSDEHKKNLSKSHIGLQSGSKHPLYGTVRSEDTRNKISESLKGQIISEETRQKLSDSLSGEKCFWYGKSHTQETKDKISSSKQGQLPWNAGVPMSEEIKERLRISHIGKSGPNLGKSMSEETKIKISNSNKGRIPWNKGKKFVNERYQNA